MSWDCFGIGSLALSFLGVILVLSQDRMHCEIPERQWRHLDWNPDSSFLFDKSYFDRVHISLNVAIRLNSVDFHFPFTSKLHDTTTVYLSSPRSTFPFCGNKEHFFLGTGSESNKDFEIMCHYKDTKKLKSTLLLAIIIKFSTEESTHCWTQWQMSGMQWASESLSSDPDESGSSVTWI